MDRRKFLASTAAGVALAGSAFALESDARNEIDKAAIDDAEKTRAKTAEEFLEAINSGAMIRMPSRQIHPERLGAFWYDELATLKGLTYAGLIQWSIDFKESEYVFWANSK